MFHLDSQEFILGPNVSDLLPDILQSLFRHVKRGAIAMLEELPLETYLNKVTSHGDTALWYAIYENRAHIAWYLLSKGARILPGMLGLALYTSRFKVAQVLIDYGANMDTIFEEKIHLRWDPNGSCMIEPIDRYVCNLSQAGVGYYRLYLPFPDQYIFLVKNGYEGMVRKTFGVAIGVGGSCDTRIFRHQYETPMDGIRWRNGYTKRLAAVLGGIDSSEEEEEEILQIRYEVFFEGGLLGRLLKILQRSFDRPKKERHLEGCCYQVGTHNY